MLYSDGLVERRGRPIDDGLELLRRAVASPDAAGAAWLAEQLRDGAHEDDISVLVVSRNG